MLPSISESGLTKKKMEKAFKFGKMVQFMRDFGSTILLMERDDCTTPMVTFMKAYY